MGTVKAHTSLKLLNEKGAKLLILVPGAGLEPARTLPGPRDFKSRVSTNSTIRARDGLIVQKPPRDGNNKSFDGEFCIKRNGRSLSDHCARIRYST